MGSEVQQDYLRRFKGGYHDLSRELVEDCDGSHHLQNGPDAVFRAARSAPYNPIAFSRFGRRRQRGPAMFADLRKDVKSISEIRLTLSIWDEGSA